MKSIVMSIRHKWAEKIYGGSKKWELRKTRPVDPDYLAQNERFVYIYEPEKKGVTGVFQLAGIGRAETPRGAAMYQCELDEAEIEAYGPGRDGLFWLWNAAAAVEYDKPLPLGTFGLLRPPRSWCYVEEEKRDL